MTVVVSSAVADAVAAAVVAIHRSVVRWLRGTVPAGRSQRLPPAAPPDLLHVREALAGTSLSFFLPAYCEGASLAVVVKGMHDYLSRLGLSELRLVIVDDGSTDSTGTVADALAKELPGVRVVHHSVNMGYGEALISGIRSAVGDECDYWGFCDSDGQFAPESVGTLLHRAVESGADLAVGRRVGRRAADSAFRDLLGHLWSLAGWITLGSELLAVDDVDCGLKVGRTRAVAEIAGDLHGQAAAISPELLARSTLAGHRVVQCDIPHLPRLGGTPTGSGLRVALRSAAHLVRLAIVLRRRPRGDRSPLPGRRPPSIPVPRSPATSGRGLPDLARLPTTTIPGPPAGRQPFEEVA